MKKKKYEGTNTKRKTLKNYTNACLYSISYKGRQLIFRKKLIGLNFKLTKLLIT